MAKVTLTKKLASYLKALTIRLYMKSVTGDGNFLNFHSVGAV